MTGWDATTPCRAATTDPLADVQALIASLSDRPTTAREDAVLCLLEAAERLLSTTAPPAGPPRTEDVDAILGCLRAASRSVRTYLWQAGRHRAG